jgi:hypothetical protein
LGGITRLERKKKFILIVPLVRSAKQQTILLIVTGQAVRAKTIQTL